MESEYLEKTMCFPLYAASREVIKRYRPLLDELDLTYTQYITMVVLWEFEDSEVTVSKLGEMLCLDSGTLTPVLKRLESKGYITRKRLKNDERCVAVCCTAEGKLLKNKAPADSSAMRKSCGLSKEESDELCRLLHKVINNLKN